MRRLAILAAVIAALAVPAIASAHPLGNFTVNHSSSVVASGDRVYVDYVLDMAEIPTLQARQAGGFDAPALSRSIAAKLSLTVDGRRVTLRPVKHRLQFLPGAAGLRTTRLEVVLAGPGVRDRATVEFEDRTYPGRLGWKEVVVSASDGARIVDSSAPGMSPSDQLRAYPKDRLSSPIDATTATATLAAGTGHGAAPAFSEPVHEKPASGFTSLVERRDLGAAGILAALAIALFWGAAHALGPGHGKSIVAAYLIGQRGSVRHAIGLGGIVTVTHTAGVFALGMVTLALSELIVPEDLYPWLNLVAGLMVVAIGIGVLRARLAHRRAHAHGHAHHHHDPPRTTTPPTACRFARSSPSASPAAFCRAPRRSSSSSLRSRYTGSRSGWRSCSHSASASRSRSAGSASWPCSPTACSAARASRGHSSGRSLR